MSEQQLTDTQMQIDFINKRIDDLEFLNRERMQALKDSIAANSTASEKALIRAEAANDKRFDSVNEFRSALSDQSQEFLRIDTYNASHIALAEKVDLVSGQVIALNSVYHQAPTPITGMSFFLGVGTVGFAFIVACITGAIQLGAVQTQVSIDTKVIEEIKQYNREAVSVNAQQNSALSITTTRQEAADKLLDKIERQIEVLFQQVRKQ